MKFLLPISLFLTISLQAYPPAPHHLIHGTVRDEFGHPILYTDAEVILETATGIQVIGKVIPGLKTGSNYELKIPMDAGITSDAYQPTALQPTVPFKLKVKVGQSIYLPIEMLGDFAQLGQPGKSTRLDLTLGEDSDRDGLPDAWERALIASRGGTLTLADIRSDDDTDGDGMSNVNEYLAGTYAFDDQNGFSLTIKRFQAGRPILKFTAIRGRTYTLQGSVGLNAWTTLEFTLPESAESNTVHQSYSASDVRVLELEAVPSESASYRFFRLKVQ